MSLEKIVNKFKTGLLGLTAAAIFSQGCGSDNTTGPTPEDPIDNNPTPVNEYVSKGTTNSSGSFTLTDPDNGDLTITVRDMSNNSPVPNTSVVYKRVDNPQGQQFRFITAYPQGTTNVRPNTLVIPLHSLNLRQASPQTPVTINVSNYVQGIPPLLANFIEERYGLDKQTIEDFLEYELGKIHGCASYPGYLQTITSQQGINHTRGESKLAMAIIKASGGGDYELKVLSTLSDKLGNDDIQGFLASIGALDKRWDLYTLDPLNGILATRNRWFDFVLPSQAPTGSITNLTVSGTNVNATVEATDRRYYSGTKVLDPTSTCIDGNNTMDILFRSNVKRQDGSFIVRSEPVGTLRMPIIPSHTYETGSITVPASNSTLPEGTYTLEYELVDEAGNIGRAGTRTFSITNPEFVSLTLEGTLQTPAIPLGISRALETFYTVRRDAFNNLTIAERFAGPPPGPVSQTFTMPETSTLGVRGIATNGTNAYIMNVDRDIIGTHISGTNLVEWTRWASKRSAQGSNSDANIFMASTGNLFEVYLSGSELKLNDWTSAGSDQILSTPETSGERFPSGAIDPTTGNLYLGFTVPGTGNFVSRYTPSGSSFVHEDTRKVPSELVGLTGLVTTEDGTLHALSAANKLYRITF